MAEENFPGYATPAGTTPGQRKGFTPEQIDIIKHIRAWRREGVRLLHAAGNTDPATGQNGRLGSAELTLALRSLQTAEFWAIRHITGGPED
ncbi:conserved protein of unknown function (plasmid) [Rhodovastum atsumiense]|uniref:Uncharacterized protein n=1 Tax=Rhodovastum atsumiense TaxID=504468 RepID=A0A5M6IUL0_9PROT|nr:hypothetical protein [Rhodovastum atsumiense]KAA5611547.1 hypothetical protein F1189_13350 [Rhodovastum atsumiense]CAH2606227.1 conserved protein of unknown function [Rhodovastum atsumiense]